VSLGESLPQRTRPVSGEPVCSAAAGEDGFHCCWSSLRRASRRVRVRTTGVYSPTSLFKVTYDKELTTFRIHTFVYILVCVCMCVCARVCMFMSMCVVWILHVCVYMKWLDPKCILNIIYIYMYIIHIYI